jgi:membrane-associated phospholipid phosphatase
MSQLQMICHQIDAAVLAAVHSYASPLLDWAAWSLSTIGWLGACWWALSVVLWFRGYRWLAAQLVIAMLFAAFGTELLKHFSHRARPSELMPQFVHLPLPNLPDSRWAFPSGHVSLAAAAAMSIVLSHYKKWAWLLIPLALLIGWSRLYQGVHWPTDVLAGLVVGSLAAVVALVVSAVIQKQWVLRNARNPAPAGQQHSEAAH